MVGFGLALGRAHDHRTRIGLGLALAEQQELQLKKLDVVVKTLEVARDLAKGTQLKPQAGGLANWQQTVDQLVRSIQTVTGANGNVIKELASALANISSPPVGGEPRQE